MLNHIISTLRNQWVNKSLLTSTKPLAIDTHGQWHEWAEYVVIPETVTALSTGKHEG